MALFMFQNNNITIKRIYMKLLNILIIFNLINLNLLAQENLQEIPSISIKTLEGSLTNSSSLQKDNLTSILCFTAITCKNCTKELNAIYEVYDDWKEEFDFEVIVISVDDTRNSSKVAPFVRALDWPFEVYLDTNSEFKRAMNVNSVPHTFIVNRNEIIWQKSGYINGDELLLYDELLKLL